MAGPVTKIRTPAELAATAASEVKTEISGETAPLEAEETRLGTASKDAVRGIGELFSTVTPYVAGAATRLGESNKAALEAEKGIFAEAKRALGELRGQRAAEGQALAQQVGGPVPLDEFTASVDTVAAGLPQTTANKLLHSLGLQQAGVTAMEAFAGRVFPLMQVEETNKAVKSYEDKIDSTKKEIARIKGTQTGRVNKRANELLLQEREYKLSQDELTLNKLKANRDWQAASASLKNERERIAIARKEFEFNKQRFKEEHGLATLTESNRHWESKQQIEQARKNGELSQAQFKYEMYKFNEQLKLSKAELKLGVAETNATIRQTALELLTAAMTPGKAQALTVTEPFPSTETAALNGEAYEGDKDGNPKVGGGFYWTLKDVKFAETSDAAITTIKPAYDFLRAAGIPARIALQLVRTRFGEPNWDPTEPSTTSVVGKGKGGSTVAEPGKGPKTKPPKSPIVRPPGQ